MTINMTAILFCVPEAGSVLSVVATPPMSKLVDSYTQSALNCFNLELEVIHLFSLCQSAIIGRPLICRLEDSLLRLQLDTLCGHYRTHATIPHPHHAISLLSCNLVECFSSSVFPGTLFINLFATHCLRLWTVHL